jgi:hypothetical protein
VEDTMSQCCNFNAQKIFQMALVFYAKFAAQIYFF